jgi:cell wall-associated NlpC family hydrolase
MKIMKKNILTAIIYLSSSTFFIGCSESAPHVTQINNKSKTKSLSVYNIMGIVEPEKDAKPFLVVKDDSSKNYNFRTIKPIQASYNSNSVVPTNMISNNIEVVSYGSYNPVVETEPIVFAETTFPEVTTLANSIEGNAKSFLGTRYVWGATGPSKFDCSGFTQWVYRDAGINIPRVSRDQAKVGNYVKYEDLQKGDMIFFDTKKVRAGKVTHVGIYLGNGNFIHASSSAKKVVVYNWDEKTFYKDRFLWGRRVIPDTMHYASNERIIY